VQACADVAEFVASPVGRCIAGRSWLYFYPHAGLCGFIVWGRPTSDDIERLVHVLRVELGAKPHVSLVDARRVEATDARTFHLLERYVRAEHTALARAVKKLAIVRPDGIVGAITAGFFGVTPPPYPVEVFDDRERALGWLGVPDARQVLDDLAREESRAVGAPPLLRDLRALVETRLDDASLARAAKSLGMSERSLQRKLGEQGTTFQAEVNAARVRVAKRFLRETDQKLTQIALEVGCSSLPSFSALFRRATGETPSAFRERSRRRP
jgi:AraC-like DNA-binding protein